MLLSLGSKSNSRRHTSFKGWFTKGARSGSPPFPVCTPRFPGADPAASDARPVVSNTPSDNPILVLFPLEKIPAPLVPQSKVTLDTVTPPPIIALAMSLAVTAVLTFNCAETCVVKNKHSTPNVIMRVEYKFLITVVFVFVERSEERRVGKEC